ncbi:hypothetical protein CJ030_MR1G013821 [Morella rubra]|uniref:Uncharacterized protein n=1 Tax=Morella rubra TaxID=262757 RepID=A0A6A1WRL8_9ROSI|nr:hypothetical protein CJ030_MR1G013821 [Morella rubra]
MDWEMLYPEVVQRRLPRMYSDYFPIMLESDTFGRGKTPFRFENMWLKEEGFVERVRGWWSSYEFSGSPSFVLNLKLKAVKGDLKVWNREVFGVLHIRKLRLFSELSTLERDG